ncbi:MAG: GNAT family N-acetyltransferase [Shimia sp.]
MIPTLTTERLTLRAPRRSDFGAYAEMLASDRIRWMGGPYDGAGAWGLFTGMTANWITDGFGGWILNRTEDVAFIGEIAIWHPITFPEPELGWTLIAEAEGHGYARKAAEVALAWYWAEHRAQSVVSYIHIDNTRSATLAHRLGAVLDPAAPFAVGDSAEDTTVWRHRRPAA